MIQQMYSCLSCHLFQQNYANISENRVRRPLFFQATTNYKGKSHNVKAIVSTFKRPFVTIDQEEIISAICYRAIKVHVQSASH